MLFFVRATARFIPVDDTTVVPPILILGPALPPHWRVRVAFTVVIGKLGKWLNQNPAALTGLLEYVVQVMMMMMVADTQKRPRARHWSVRCRCCA